MDLKFDNVTEHDRDTFTATDALGTDVRDMERLGKKQEFRRNFGLWSALGFVSIYLATWEFVLVSLSVGFPNGGFAGLFWCFVVTVCCYATIVASLAEMESMAPTSGGQYHWVSEFAPPQYQRLLSYASGWMSTLGWLASVAASVNVLGVEIEALVEVILPDFAFTGWQLTLVMYAFILITIVFNTYGARVLPKLEIVSLIGHLLGFFVVMIPLLVLCPKNTAFDVFVNFQDNSGYNNIGIAYLTSQVTVMYCNLGSDSVVHISEEVEDASLTVPRCMWWSYVGNVVLGIIMLIVMLFCIGPLDAVIDSDVPYLLLFNNAGSPGLSVFLNVILFILIFAGNITALATCAREIWAFSRDRGLPASKWIGKMNYNLNVPDNAVYLTSFFCGILALINIGSTLAFNIIISVSVLGATTTTSCSLESWKIRHCNQSFWLSVFRLYNCIRLFSYGTSCGYSKCQLGTLGLGARYSACCSRVCTTREATLYGSGGVCGRQESCWHWITVDVTFWGFINVPFSRSWHSYLPCRGSPRRKRIRQVPLIEALDKPQHLFRPIVDYSIVLAML